MMRSEKGYVEFPGSRIYYEVDGSGPALTFIHACVAHLRMWDAQVEAFRDRYTVVRYDLRGFGRSQTEDVPFSSRDDLRRVLDHVGVESTHLVGNSCGGSIALDFALEFPDRARSLTLVASGVGGFESPDDPRVTEREAEIERLYELKDYERIVELETQIWTDGADQPPTRVDSGVRQRMTQWNLDNYRAEQENEHIERLTPPAVGRLGEVAVPTLVIWGTLDVSSVLLAGEKLAAEIPAARAHVYPNVAHMVTLEKPGEFNELLGGFLAEADAAERIR
jgi:pimeloyl-ACP methyl ester carboxylesterase